MKMIVDSREQHALRFTVDEILTEVKVEKLIVGDYQAEYTDGSRPPIIFERKSLSDCFSTLTGGYKRFKAELTRAKSANVKLILAIEGSVADVLGGTDHSKVEGITILRKLCTLWLKYDLVPVFFESRQSMAKFIYEFYCAFGRLYSKKATSGEAHG